MSFVLKPAYVTQMYYCKEHYLTIIFKQLMHFFIDICLKIASTNQMVFSNERYFMPLQYNFGELFTKIIFNKKNLKLLISASYKENMIKLLQNKIQVPNRSKLQLAAKFSYYIYPKFPIVDKLMKH